MTLRILFVAANPKDRERLDLSLEYRKVDEAINTTEYRKQIDLRAKLAINFTNLNEALMRHRPTILHFGGHGTPAHEVSFVADDGTAHPVPPETLAELLRLHQDTVRLVVLNACYSEVQAQAIVEHVDCAVGMVGEIDDPAALMFAEEFYKCIGYGKSVQYAFDAAKVITGATWKRDLDIPRIVSKPGANLDELHLLELPETHAVRPRDPDVVHVDRDTQLEIFEAMLSGDGDVHVLAIEAPSGMGKTRLMEEFEKRATALEGARVAMIRLGASLDDPIDVLGRLVSKLDEGNDFPSFQATLTDVANAGDQSARVEKMQLQRLTKAFVDDLVAVEATGAGPVLLLFDTYNKPHGVVETWLASQFLSSIARHRPINVIVAGQAAPQLPPGGSAEKTEVGRLEPHHIREWARLLGIEEVQSDETVHLMYITTNNGVPALLRDRFFLILQAKDDHG